MFSSNATQVSAVTQAEAVDFDGTNDYLTRASNLTGNTDGKTLTFSGWLWGYATENTFYSAGAGSELIILCEASSGSLRFRVLGTDELGAQCLSVQVGTGLAPSLTWTHFLISIDLSNTARRYIYINDVLTSPSWVEFQNVIMDRTYTTYKIGYNPSSLAYLKGRMSNIFLDYTYRDLSITANRRLFVTADLKPAAGQAALNPIIYFPMSNPTTVATNLGTGGNFTLNGTVARSGRGPNQYNAPYSDLDGSTQYLSKTSVTGMANSSTFTINLCFSLDVTTASWPVQCGGNEFGIRLLNGTMLVQGYATGSVFLLSASVTGFVVGRNYVVTISMDMTDSSKRYIYVNGQAASVTWTQYNSGSIQFNQTWRVGRESTTPYFNGRIGALWFNTSYIDLSVASNLAKFVSGTGITAAPVDLGATGELPTGTAPLIYLPMYGGTDNAGKNYGTGGDFTVNSGPFTGARGPNEYWASAVGNSGYLYRDTPLSGATDTKTLTFFALFKPTSINVTRSFWFTAGSASSAFRGQLQVKAGNGFSIAFTNSAGVFVLNATVTNILIDSTTKTYAIHCCIDLSDTAKRAIYINGVAATVTWTTYTNDTMNFSAQRSAFGAEWGTTWTGSLLRGNLGGFYLANTYIDFTQESNRLLFADAFNYATNLPAAITANTVPNPLVYMLFDPANNGANSGTGGNYTNSSMSDGGQL